MEKIIKEFLNIAVNAGYGSGDGSGDGSGYGSGDGSGYGSGDGSGDGDGYGSGDGSGSGYGDGDGDGYGSGDGSGSGSGYGSGDGSGSGYGYGDGSGDGSKQNSIIAKESINHAEYQKGCLTKKIASLKSFQDSPVYYVDNIPCIFLSIKANLAKVLIISDDFTAKKGYIAKANNLFAHGDTKEEAIQAVNDKFYASLSFEEKREEFIKKFKLLQKYPNKVFFEWHHFLTGSCETGRKMFVDSKDIDLNAEMTTQEFLNFTQNEYNGEVIREIISRY